MSSPMGYGGSMHHWNKDCPQFSDTIWSDNAFSYIRILWSASIVSTGYERIEGSFLKVTPSQAVKPFLIRGTMKAESHLSMLQDEDWPVFVHIYFNCMPNGAPPQFTITVCELSINYFQDVSWINGAYINGPKSRTHPRRVFLVRYDQGSSPQ